jgi:hypothetical protein
MKKFQQNLKLAASDQEKNIVTISLPVHKFSLPTKITRTDG